MNDDMDKVIERIRRLLAMAADSSSPNEAAIAARRAQSMLDKYQLDAADILVDELSAADINHEFEWTGNSAPQWKQWLAVTCADINECGVRFKGYKLTRGYEFVGVGPDPIVAAEIYKYLTNETTRLAKLNGGGKAAINDFCVGCAKVLCQRLRDLAAERATTSSSTALVVHKQSILQDAGYAFTYSTSKSRHRQGSAYYDGRRAGESINLADQLEGSKAEQIK